MRKYLILLIILHVSTDLLSQTDVNKYLWEYPLQQNLELNTELTATLQSGMQAVIDSGNLFFRPLTCRYGDQMYDNYLLYHEPGRLLQTVALSYPYLTLAQQTALRQMVAQLLGNNVHAPWSVSPLASDAGNRRDLFQAAEVWGQNSIAASYRPTIQGVYSLWLYLYRTGDTATIQPWYNTIKTFYNNKVGNNVDPGNLYGTMCAHIGMARLAKIFDDNAQVAVATANLTTNLNNGLDIHYIDSMAFYGRNGWNAPYGNEYDPRKDGWVYRGYIFLNLSPEIGRYLKDTLLTEISQRHNEGLQRFPLWWIRQTPYFTRWTGDESVGIPSESFGMFTPVERWVLNRDAETMASYMLSSPIGVADCYWLESLVYAIESNATDLWTDVRTTPFETDFVVNLPVVSTLAVTGITTQAAVSGGNISGDGGALVIARGVVWNTEQNPTLTDNFTANGTGMGAFASQLTGLQPETTYFVRAYATNSAGTAYGNQVTFNTGVNTSPTLNLTLFLEGLFDPETESMRKANNEYGGNFPGNIADQITVRLAQSTPPFSIVENFGIINLYVNGSCYIPLPSALSGNYYVVITHRNSIESWSAVPILFTGNSILYDFTDASGKTYGNNARFTENRYCLFGGDVNQDGVVDTGDMTPVDNDSNVFATGYLSTDVNGDGMVDTGDVTIIDNNSHLFINAITPQNQ